MKENSKLINALQELLKQAEGKTENNTQVEKKARKPISPVFLIAKSAMKELRRYPSELQTAYGKGLAVEAAIRHDQKRRFADVGRFWDAGHEETVLLDRASDLKKYCEDHLIDYEAVKQHMLLEGKGFMKDIVLNGIHGKEALIESFRNPIYIKPFIQQEQKDDTKPGEQTQEATAPKEGNDA